MEFKFDRQDKGWIAECDTQLSDGPTEVRIYGVPGQANPIDQQVALVTKLSSLSTDVWYQIAEAVYQYAFRKWGRRLSDYGIAGAADVRDACQLLFVAIPPIGRRQQEALAFVLDCDWDPEHGAEVYLLPSGELKATEHDANYTSDDWWKQLD